MPLLQIGSEHQLGSVYYISACTCLHQTAVSLFVDKIDMRGQISFSPSLPLFYSLNHKRVGLSSAFFQGIFHKYVSCMILSKKPTKIAYLNLAITPKNAFSICENIDKLVIFAIILTMSIL